MNMICFGHSFISVTGAAMFIPKETQPTPKPKIIYSDPKMAYDAVVKQLNKKNEEIFDRIDYQLYEAYCECEQDECICNLVASYSIIYHFIKLVYEIMPHKRRKELKRLEKKWAREALERQKNLEEMNNGKGRYITIPAKIVYK